MKTKIVIVDDCAHDPQVLAIIETSFLPKEGDVLTISNGQSLGEKIRVCRMGEVVGGTYYAICERL